MDNETLALIVTIVLAVSALAWTVLGVQRLRGTRHLLRGAGLTLLPIGLWLTGVMELLVSGAKGVFRFFRDSPLDSMMIAGLVVAAFGVLLFLLASAVKPVTHMESRERRLARDQTRGRVGARERATETHRADHQLPHGRGTAAGASSTAQPTAHTQPTAHAQSPAHTQTSREGATVSQPAGSARPQGRAAAGLDSEDAEIEALLRKRGIE